MVKELVENSLDAEASQIDIDIDKGGHKRIRIRDNGKGIAKDELCLALSRHATSKITCLDDLERILSLGFRGEALASISSVARLTLTSKPDAQAQAWEASAEGREMDVALNPAAHPKGTTVDVRDLFFNTPARRKFLRTEKTEFNHIDEVIRRIALSRLDVGFTLKHNGKVVRKYPAVDEEARLKRLAAVCGKAFAEQAVEIRSQYDSLTLTGWLSSAAHARTQNDLQYVYVNGRMMRDKLINHAIRQAYEGLIPPETFPAFVLYLELDPEHVDVNVHPAKHEVRFHQARLVHDFIFRAMTDVLENNLVAIESTTEPAPMQPVVPKHDYIRPLQPNVDESRPAAYQAPSSRSAANTKSAAAVSATAAQHYQDLVTPVAEATSQQDALSWLRADERHILFRHAHTLYVLDLCGLHRQRLLNEYAEGAPVSQPLLMPVSIDNQGDLLSNAQQLYEPLLTLSIEIGWTASRILLRKVPAGARQLPWTQILPAILATVPEDPKEAATTRALLHGSR